LIEMPVLISIDMNDRCLSPFDWFRSVQLSE
jgi:hypothetical protein